MKRVRGFTIVEIAIVITVISILVTLIIVSFNVVQRQSRDKSRDLRITQIAEALEKFYDANGEYPSCALMTQSAATIKSNLLTTIDPVVLKSPTSSDAVTNSIVCVDTNLPAQDVYAYIGDGSGECLSNKVCTNWTLKYKHEADNQVVTLGSRRP